MLDQWITGYCHKCRYNKVRYLEPEFGETREQAELWLQLDHNVDEGRGDCLHALTFYAGQSCDDQF